MGEAIVYGIKVGLAIAAAVGFMAAVVVLISVFDGFTAPTIFAEVCALIGIYLPFRPATVFGTFLVIALGVCGFLIARKVYQVTAELNKSSG